MLEFPECVIYAKEMNKQLKGRTIVSVEVNQSPHKFAFFSGDADKYPETLEGLHILGCSAYGGMVILELEEYRLVFTDGAYPRYTAPEKKQPLHHQLFLEFDDESSLSVRIQMYGCMLLFHESEHENQYYEFAITKPSPISKEFTYEYFRQICMQCSGRTSAKALLATEQRIPGLGNGVLQDILYHAQIHPKRKLDSLTEEELHKIYESIPKVLNEMIKQGGRDTEKDFFGEEGKYMTYLSKKTYLTPCPKCGQEIRKAAFMGGTIYFCEKCQPL